MRRAFQIGGVCALVEQRRGPRNPHPNWAAPEIDEQIQAMSLEFPTSGTQCLANEPRPREVNVSPSGVRGVWLRHALETLYKRLMSLQVHAQDDTVVLSEEKI